ncbi:MAG: methyltransferase domain-containing protein [Pyrinomonadaceae bacterium]
MTKDPRLDTIPRGNTCRGVNRSVIEAFLGSADANGAFSILDVPCGDGDLLDAVKVFFPNAATFGIDISSPDEKFAHHFTQADAAFLTRDDLPAEPCRLISCISGVMEFDNSLNFFRLLRDALEDDGRLVVTNDNLLTVRDRFLYFLFGRFGQYKAFLDDDAQTWKVVPMHTLVRVLKDAGLEVESVRYVVGRSVDWLWLAIGLPIYAIQLLYFIFGESNRGLDHKLRNYPLRSLIARHYLLVCKKGPQPRHVRPALLDSGQAADPEP